MRSTIRYLVAVAAVVSFGLAAAAPAAADKPLEETVTVPVDEFFGAYFVPEAFNACTGEFLPGVAVDITALSHLTHPNNYVSVHGTRAVNAADTSGYALSGTDRVTFSYVTGDFSWVINDDWTAPDGARFKLQMRLFDDGRTVEFPDRYDLSGRCLTGETVLPAP